MPVRIAVVGATGTAGSRTSRQVERAGHECVRLSRGSGVDLHTGEGLVEALQGATVVIDTSNPVPPDPQTDLTGALAGATRNLVEACTSAGVEHLVFLSICNIDKPVFDQFPYYVAKRAQQRVVEDSTLAATIICSTQWHEFATNPSVVTFTEDGVDVEDWLIQPIAVDTVAEVLVDAAVRRPASQQITGPEEIRLPELTRAYLATQEDTRPVRPVPPRLPELAQGALLPPPQAERLGPTVQEWLDRLRR